MRTFVVSRRWRTIAALAAAAVAAVSIGLAAPASSQPAQPVAEFDTSPM